jgi:hypothetical protein
MGIVAQLFQITLQIRAQQIHLIPGHLFRGQLQTHRFIDLFL